MYMNIGMRQTFLTSKSHKYILGRYKRNLIILLSNKLNKYNEVLNASPIEFNNFSVPYHGR